MPRQGLRTAKDPEVLCGTGGGKSRTLRPLCILCVLCVSVVNLQFLARRARLGVEGTIPGDFGNHDHHPGRRRNRQPGQDGQLGHIVRPRQRHLDHVGPPRPRLLEEASVYFQDLILKLQAYWASRGCLLVQGYDQEVGAGTMHPATFLRVLGPADLTRRALRDELLRSLTRLERSITANGLAALTFCEVPIGKP